MEQHPRNLLYLNKLKKEATFIHRPSKKPCAFFPNHTLKDLANMKEINQKSKQRLIFQRSDRHAAHCEVSARSAAIAVLASRRDGRLNLLGLAFVPRRRGCPSLEIFLSFFSLFPSRRHHHLISTVVAVPILSLSLFSALISFCAISPRRSGRC